VSIKTPAYGGRAIITFHNEDNKHFYTVKVPDAKWDELQPGVTTIVGKLDKSGPLVPWAVSTMAARIKELTPQGSTDRDVFLGIVDAAKETWRQAKNESADIGSLAHRALEQELNYRAGKGPKPTFPVTANELLAPNLTPEMVEMANNSIRAGLQYFDEHHIELIFSERPLWSPTYGYIGTTDGIAHIDGKLSVFDFKTGLRLYSTVWIQLAAYAKAYMEEFPGQEIVQRVGINVCRDGNLETETRNNDTLADDFKTFLALLQALRWEKNQGGRWTKPVPPPFGPLDKALAAVK
jgi:hypothetical protein